MFSFLIISGAATFLLIVFLLHFLKREIEPSWRMISEYEIGRFGWLMRLAFICLSISCAALLATTHAYLSPINELFLGVAAFGLWGAAIYATDPITTPREAMSGTSRLHAVFGVLFIFGFPVAAALITWNSIFPLSNSFRLLVSVMSVLVWLGLIAFMVSTAVYGRSKEASGPGVKIGWPNRVMMLINVAWLLVAGFAFR